MNGNVAETVNMERARLAKELKRKRESAGRTQEDVAAAMGVSRPHVANMERGEGFSVEVMLAYAAAVGMTVQLVEAAR